MGTTSPCTLLRVLQGGGKNTKNIRRKKRKEKMKFVCMKDLKKHILRFIKQVKQFYNIKLI